MRVSSAFDGVEVDDRNLNGELKLLGDIVRIKNKRRNRKQRRISNSMKC